MRVVVTGAGGFVGRRLVERLGAHEVVALDVKADGIPELPHVQAVAGDLCDPEVLNLAMQDGCDAVVHLATIPGGAAEADPELAKRVNVDGTMALLNVAAGTGQCPRFVFASSIAVFGAPLSELVDDSTPALPTLLYGAHKAMMEQWIAVLSRRGAIDGISLRLSGVVARPRGPSGMKSAFMSEVFHALASREPTVLPVSATATSWLTSVDCAVRNFVHALHADLHSVPRSRAATLPALRVRIGDLVSEIAGQVGAAVTSVDYDADNELEASFGAYPPLTTSCAEALGFASDGNLSALVSSALRDVSLL